LLAIIVGVAIVAFGGGGIQTARGYWERVSRRAEMKASEIQREADPRLLVNAARRSLMFRSSNRNRADQPATPRRRTRKRRRKPMPKRRNVTETVQEDGEEGPGD
jgi:hypothetical protein